MFLTEFFGSSLPSRRRHPPRLLRPRLLRRCLKIDRCGRADSNGATVVSVPSLLRTTSAARNDLCSPLHEEGGSSASAPLDEDSTTVIERLREFLLLGVREMTLPGRSWSSGPAWTRLWRSVCWTRPAG
ncbi:hypothetical protein Pyn_27932 [Prunus yedoensis var. nudiflora]|uniref:Uncharacterized protein n=1 Tax=Prunus yedoensis var. nudiflora TaxID=2094558 RepID=A0A314YEN7_PRUYE|nr:hypothetical protein Pyn_27932 [Prunus yedoensis var. nudiflora]